MKQWVNIAKGALVLSILPLSWFFIHPGVKIKPALDSKPELSIPGSSPKASRTIDLFNNRNLLEINFYGDALKNSSFSEQELVLHAERQKGWAYAQINFTFPVDLLQDSLIFMVKAASAGRKLRVSLTDVNKWTSVQSDSYSVDLTDDWQRVIINSENIKDLLNIDKSKVANIKLIVDQLVEKDSINKIYVKDFKLVENSK